MITSISSVFLNKYLMDLGEFTFHYPLTMTWFQLVVALVCIYCSYSLNRYVCIDFMVPTRGYRTLFCFNFLPNFEFKMDTAIHTMPLSLLYVGMLTFNNLCLDYADIHVYHTARSISICFTALFTFVLLGETIPKKIIGACALVFIGYAMGGLEELHISTISSIGMGFGLISSCLMALYSIQVKKLLAVYKNHWILMIYNVIGAILFLFPICVMTGEFQKATAVSYLFNSKFLAILIVTALIAYVVNISNFLLISYTSPLTNSVAISVRSVIESFLSLFIHGTSLSGAGMLSSAFTVLGTYLYTWLKLKDMQKKNLMHESFID